MDDVRIKRICEALLFSTTRPLSVAEAAEVLPGVPSADIRRCLRELCEEHRERHGGFNLLEVAQGFQFRSAPDLAPWVQQLRRAKPTRLSSAALETLAIVTYRQPVVRADIERIRGVDCGGVLRSLLERRLIRIMGRESVPGRPILYGTTREFLELFSLKSLESLPDLDELESAGVQYELPGMQDEALEEEGRRPTPGSRPAEAAPAQATPGASLTALASGTEATGGAGVEEEEETGVRKPE